jgi:hypothetical protein
MNHKGHKGHKEKKTGSSPFDSLFVLFVSFVVRLYRRSTARRAAWRRGSLSAWFFLTKKLAVDLGQFSAD